MTSNKVFALTGLLFSLAFSAMPAHAQATRTWVSGVGDDANPCSRTAPCKTFAGAISKTATGGEINTLDPGGYGAVTITKSITISNEGVGEAGVLVAGTNGIVVSAGANDVVTIRGLVIEGLGLAAQASINGIRFISGKELHVQNTVIRNFTAASPNGFGILFSPPSSARLFVSDTIITGNGNGSNGGGIGLIPQGPANLSATILRTQLQSNTNGYSSSPPGGTSTNSYIRNSLISGNSGNGVTISGSANVFVDESTVISNTGIGVGAASSSAAIVSDSTITLNGVGVNPSSGGIVLSYGNNRLVNNGSNGSFTPPNLTPN